MVMFKVWKIRVSAIAAREEPRRIDLLTTLQLSASLIRHIWRRTRDNVKTWLDVEGEKIRKRWNTRLQDVTTYHPPRKTAATPP